MLRVLVWIFVFGLSTSANITLADTLILSDAREDKITFIHLETGQLLGRVESTDNPHEVAVSPNQRHVAVASFGSNKVDFFEIESMRPIGSIIMGRHRYPHGLLWLDDTRLAVTTEGSEHLVFLNTETMTVEKASPTQQRDGHMVYRTPDRTRLIVPNMGSGSVTIFDAESGDLQDIIQSGRIAQGAAFAPRRKQMWITNSGDHTVTIFDLDSYEIINQIPTDRRPVRVWISPDENTAVTANYYGGTLTIIDMETMTAWKTISFPGWGRNAGPVYLQGIDEGRKLLVALINSDEIKVLDTTSWEIISEIETYGEVDGMDIVTATPN